MNSGLLTGSFGRSLVLTTFTGNSTNSLLSRRETARQLVHAAGHDEHDPLADILHPVRHALEVVRGPQQVRGLVDGARIGQHDRQQLAVDLLVQRIDLVVLGGDGLGGHHVALDERIERRGAAC